MSAWAAPPVQQLDGGQLLQDQGAQVGAGTSLSQPMGESKLGADLADPQPA